MSHLPVLVVTPHNSGHVPQDILGEMLVAQERRDLDARERRLRALFEQGDPYTDVLFDVPGAHALHATVSRFVVDLNRDRTTGGANGVVKVTDFDATPLYPEGRTPGEAAVEQRLRRYWDPFHAEIRRILREQPIELLLDGHSMTALEPAIGPDRRKPRPALTLMTGGDGDGEQVTERPPTVSPAAARALRDAAGRRFAAILDQAGTEGVPPEVALNDPWSADELSYLHGPAAGIPAFGLEINRALYLESTEGSERPRSQRILELQSCVAHFSRDALDIVRSHRQGGST